MKVLINYKSEMRQDKFLLNESGFEFYLISLNSNWWQSIIKLGYDCDSEFVPPLSKRMSIEEHFARFQTEQGFTIVAIKENEFVGFICNFYHHPESNKSWYQCFIITQKFRQKSLSRYFFHLSDEILKERGQIFVKIRTWVENSLSRKVISNAGFYLREILSNDRGFGIHTLVFEKSLYRSEYFRNLNYLGIIGGLGSNTSAKFYSDLSKLTSQTKNEQDQIPIFLLSAPQTPDRTTMLFAKKQEDLVLLLISQVKQLINQGVSHIVICCFTYHAVLNYLPLELKNKIVSFIDYTISLLNLRKGKYLILQTNGSYYQNFYKELSNVTFLSRVDQITIHNLIYKIKSGEPDELVMPEFKEVISNYKCEGILIACTDLCLISDRFEEHFKNLDIINPLKVMTYDIIDQWRQTLSVSI